VECIESSQLQVPTQQMAELQLFQNLIELKEFVFVFIGHFDIHFMR
jgi:hypothetical protein